MKDTVPRVALIGISGYGRVYLEFLEAFHAQGRLKFVAAAVVNPGEEREACARLQAHGVHLHGSWQDLLEQEGGGLDLCLIPVPIHLHAEMTVAALEAGAHVLVEKPLAGSLEQAREIQQAEKRTGRWVAVGYQDYYTQSTRSITTDLAAGRIGRIENIKWLGLWPRPQSYYERNNWAGRLSLDERPVRDSPLNNAMAHYLNLALFWAGSQAGQVAWPEEVTGELYRHFSIESFDTAVVRLATDTEVDIWIAASHYCGKDTPIHLRIQGSEGEMTWISRETVTWESPQATQIQNLESFHVSVERMLNQVLQRLDSPDVAVCTTANALPHVACIEALHQFVPIDALENLECWEQPYLNGTLGASNNEKMLRQCFAESAFPSQIQQPTTELELP